MRLSTSMLHELGMTGLHRQQSEQLRLQEQIASGRRVNKPSDDPIASAAMVNIDHARSLNSQYGANAATALSSLTLEEQALGDATRVLQDVKTVTVKAGNAVLTNTDRASLATELQGLYDELLGIANRTDADGSYLFSGFQGTTQPFTQTAPGVVAFAGDEGQRLLQVGAQRRIAIGDSGAEIFQRVREGNGYFVASAAAANTGTAVVGEGTVRDPQAWLGAAHSGNYTVTFFVDNASPPVTTYDVIDDTSNVSMLTGLPPAAGPHARTYQDGAPIVLQREAGDPSAAAWNAGVDFRLSGAPASGDTLEVDRAQNRDVFATIHSLMATLTSPIAPNASSRAAFQNRLNLSNASIDRALDQVLTARSATGSRLQELESVRSSSSDLNIHYEADLSRLRDLDYAQALSDLTRKQTGLEAAQKSYIAITRLSLFDLI